MTVHQTCFNTIGEGCGRLLPLSGFHRRGRLRDGSPRYTALCRECSNEKKREWRAANPDRVTAYNKRDWRVHRDARQRRNAEYRQANRDALIEADRARYARDRPVILAKAAKYRLDHLEAEREADRRYRTENRDEINARRRETSARRRALR